MNDRVTHQDYHPQDTPDYLSAAIDRIRTEHGMSDEYRAERGTWTSGFGDTHNVLDVYCDTDDRDDPFARLIILDDGTCERSVTMAPVYMRTEMQYPSVEAATAAMIAAHKAWREDMASGAIPDWTAARGVLAKGGKA